MRMKTILVVPLCAFFAASCNVKKDDSHCPPEPVVEMTEVVVYENINDIGEWWIEAMLPDGSVRKRIVNTYPGYQFLTIPGWPSIGSDGNTVLFVDPSGIYTFSLREARFSAMLPNVLLDPNYEGYYRVNSGLSSDMREINSEWRYMEEDIYRLPQIISWSRSNELTTVVRTPTEPFSNTRLTGDDSHFVYISSDPDTGVDVIRSIERAGHNLKTILTFNTATDGSLVSLATIPSPTSRELIYLALSADGTQYRFVRTDLDGSYQTMMDAVAVSGGEIQRFTANANADKISYFTQLPDESITLTVKYFSNNQPTGEMYVIPMSSELMWYGTYREYIRPYLGSIRSDLWDRIPTLP